jgi:thioester reductase-like protein
MSLIQQFYAGKSVLITGTTGFVGKVLLAKILRDVTRIRKLYILVRPKRGKLPMDRINQEIFKSQCFDTVKREMGLSNF